MSSKNRAGCKETKIGLIPQEWGVEKFSELLVNKTRNGLYKTKEFHGRGVKMINMGELFAYPRLGDADMELVELSESERGRFLVREGDLIFARRSLVAEGAGKCSLVIGNVERTFESSIIQARPDPEKAVSEFLFYFFSSNFGKHQLDSILRHVAVAGITGTDLMNLEIPVPPLIEQQAIAKVLSVIDSKIDLNEQMNKTLGGIAEALFKRWFVDFEFPNQEGKPYKLSGGKMVDSELGYIPSGWKVDVASKMFKLEYGWHLPEWDRKEGKIPVFGSGGVSGFHFESFVDGPGIIVGRAGKIGADSVYYSHTDFCPLETTFYVTTPGKSYFRFLYFLIKTMAMVNTGSSVPNLSRKHIHEANIVTPDSKIIAEYDTMVLPLFASANLNSEQNKVLSSIRNIILPKLMSGKIRVPIDQGNMEASQCLMR